MVYIEYVFNQYYLIAQCLNLISYSQSNFLILRLLFIASSLFFVIFAITSDSLQLDTCLFNLTFFIINIWRSIPLFMDLVPPKLSSELEEIYNNYFHRFMRKQEFELLFSKASRIVYKKSCFLVKEGNGFSSIFFIPSIPKNCEATTILKNNQEYNIKEYSWLGIMEFLNMISDHQKLTKSTVFKNTGYWEMRIKLDFSSYDSSTKLLEKKSDNKVSNFSNKPEIASKFVPTKELKVKEKRECYFSSKKDISINIVNNVEDDQNDYIELTKLLFNESEVNSILKNYKKNDNNTIDSSDDIDYLIVYEFDLIKLVEIFKTESFGPNIMKALYSMWLEVCCFLVKLKNEKNIDVMKQQQLKKTTNLNKTSNQETN